MAFYTPEYDGSSSGGGFTRRTASETPNGVLVVFTFAAASAKPAYIVSDNVWMRDVTASGTVNWTWNSGAKQATLTIAPTDEIFALE